MSKKQVRIEEMLCKDEGVLQTNNGTASAEILDIELDPLKCSFNNDDCVQIDTKDYSFITLSMENLDTLQRLIDEARDYYGEYFRREKDNK